MIEDEIPDSADVGPGQPTEPSRAPLLATVSAVVLVVTVVVLLAAGLLLAPRQIEVVATPDDALISIEGGPSANGRLLVSGVPGGSYRVTVSREGFESRRVTLDAARASGPVRIDLVPAEVELRVEVSPPDSVVSVFQGTTRVLAGRRRVAGPLPSGTYRVVATASGRRAVEREIFLDRPTRMTLLLDPIEQQTRTVGIVEATGGVRLLEFSSDASLLAASIAEPPPDREVFAVDTLRRLPDDAAGQMRGGFSAGLVGRSVTDPSTETTYALDAKAPKLIARVPGQPAQAIASFDARPRLVALSPEARLLVVATVRSWDRLGEPQPGVFVLRLDGSVVDALDSPTATAITVAPDGRTAAVADTLDGRIRLLELPRPPDEAGGD